MLCHSTLLSKLINSLPLPQCERNGCFFRRTPWRIGCILYGSGIFSLSAFKIVMSSLFVGWVGVEFLDCCKRAQVVILAKSGFLEIGKGRTLSLYCMPAFSILVTASLCQFEYRRFEYRECHPEVSNKDFFDDGAATSGAGNGAPVAAVTSSCSSCCCWCCWCYSNAVSPLVKDLLLVFHSTLVLVR